MNEIEMAISDLFNARNSDSLTEFPSDSTIDLAIKALQEKLDREKQQDGWPTEPRNPTTAPSAARMA